MLLALLRPAGAAVIRGPGDANIYLSVSELAAIPETRKRSAPALRRGTSERGASERGEPVDAVQLIAWNEPYSRLAEAFRGAAASVLFCMPASAHRVIVVTSACSGEGKSTVAANLGVMLAAAGNRVLLVDGDMRRPSLHRIFSVENARGLSELLGEADADRTNLPFEYGSWTEVPGLTLLRAARSRPMRAAFYRRRLCRS